MSKVFELSHVT